MIKNDSYLFTIDDIFDPNSRFWKKIYKDMGAHIGDIADYSLQEIEKEIFMRKILDFVENFKTISGKKSSNKIVDEIEEAELVITEVLWTLVNESDREILFHNDVEYFNDWIDTCPQPLLDAYINRLAAGESLVQLTRDNKSKKIDKIKDAINISNNTLNACNVSITNGKLTICSTNHDILKKFTKILVNSGNRVCSYKEEKTDTNLTVHSYIFETKKNNE